MLVCYRHRGARYCCKPFLTPTVKPAADGSDLLGKTASELQSDVTVSDDSISGILNYVSGYTGFSSVPAEQSGNYLALSFETDDLDTITTVQLVGGSKGPVTLDEDMHHILRITDPDTQSINVVTTKGDKSVSKTYNLSGLILETEAI